MKKPNAKRAKKTPSSNYEEALFAMRQEIERLNLYIAEQQHSIIGWKAVVSYLEHQLRLDSTQ